MRYSRMYPVSIFSLTPAAWGRSSQRQRVVKRMNPENWVVASIGVIIAVTEYAASYNPFVGAVIVEDVSPNGRYVKVRTVAVDTDGNSPDVFGARSVWRFAAAYTRIADSVAEYKLVRKVRELESKLETAQAIAKQEAREDILKLSRNTVTRALVHAYDNDYCAETAVALISAGHKLPDLWVDVEVTYRGRIQLEGKRSYYPLRKIFGATRGEVNGASGMDIGDYAPVADAIAEAIAGGDMSQTRVSHLDTRVEWHEPIIRADAADLPSNEQLSIMDGNSRY